MKRIKDTKLHPIEEYNIWQGRDRNFQSKDAHVQQVSTEIHTAERKGSFDSDHCNHLRQIFDNKKISKRIDE
uniref:Uncharacterized protein n=1 Tax=Romanomermis culicivorax TaxID=13658 RepID=A0A915JS75_ROMCU